MKEALYWEALNEAYKEEMRRDSNVITFGEDIAISGYQLYQTHFSSKQIAKKFEIALYNFLH